MTTLIPVNDEAVDKLNEILANNHFPNVDHFINMYNVGMLRPDFEIVKDIASLIDNTYKNVRLINRKFVIRSSSEVSFDNTILLLENWKLISTLKRVSIQLLEENYANNTKLIFLEEKPGYLMLEYPQEDGTIELKEYWIKDKLFSSQKDLIRNYFLKNSLHDYEGTENPNDKYINIEAVIDVDDSFISGIEELVLSNTLN